LRRRRAGFRLRRVRQRTCWRRCCAARNRGPGRAEGALALRPVAHLSAIEGNPQAAITLGGADEYPPFSPPARALREGKPVLSASGEEDFDRWMAARPARAAKAAEYGRWSVRTLADVDLPPTSSWPAWTTW
jgi:hypothetical protein